MGGSLELTGEPAQLSERAAGSVRDSVSKDTVKGECDDTHWPPIFTSVRVHTPRHH